MSDKTKVKAKGVVELSEAVEYLKQLLACAQKGKVAVISQGQGLELTLPKYVKLEVEAEEKDGKRELSWEMSWKGDLKKAEDFDLKITSSDDPEVRECLRTELAAQEQPPCAEV